MKTIFDYTQTNILVIPQALFGMDDVTVLMQHGNSAVFYKCLEQDLTDVEFYTNNPCFIYIESGREVLTNHKNDTIDLSSGSSIFLPQGLNLHSDFVKKAETLKAYLVFFDDDIVADYLRHTKKMSELTQSNKDFCLLEKTHEFMPFFNSLQTDIKNTAYLHTKLQELLHLIAWKVGQDIFYSLLATTKRMPPKANLARLLQRHDILHLTVNDLAHISGRSLSSFNRDFKEIYAVTPKKWLQDKRLSYARQLLENKECSVTDVAMKVGYENVSNFIKAFKLKYGLTPKQI